MELDWEHGHRNFEWVTVTKGHHKGRTVFAPNSIARHDYKWYPGLGYLRENEFRLATPAEILKVKLLGE